MTRRPYIGEVDLFAVDCRENAKVYLVPIEDLPVRTAAALRVDPPRNNQLAHVRWARDYELGTVAIGGLRAPSGA